MELDLHGLYLNDAIDEIVYGLEECVRTGHQNISLIHGHRGGNVLKNYIRSDAFLQEMKKAGYILKRKKSLNPGVTNFVIIGTI